MPYGNTRGQWVNKCISYLFFISSNGNLIVISTRFFCVHALSLKPCLTLYDISNPYLSKCVASLVPDNKVHGADMGPPGSCQPQLGPMLTPWTLLSGMPLITANVSSKSGKTNGFIVNSSFPGSRWRPWWWFSIISWISQHIEARHHFQIHILEWKCLNSD